MRCHTAAGDRQGGERGGDDEAVESAFVDDTNDRNPPRVDEVSGVSSASGAAKSSCDPTSLRVANRGSSKREMISPLPNDREGARVENEI
jgi:hypothetical protein